MNKICEAIDFSREKVQEHTDKIQNAINPVRQGDLPFIVFAMRKLTEALESEMDAEQKAAAGILELVLRQEKTVISGGRDMFKDFAVGGGQVDGIQDLSILRCFFRP